MFTSYNLTLSICCSVLQTVYFVEILSLRNQLLAAGGNKADESGENELNQ